MTRRSLVYVAGQYTVGDTRENVRLAITAADDLLVGGFAPYVPHLTFYWDRRFHHDYETWLELDLCWLAKCDALLRLPGESPGADREVQFAVQNDIPVFHNLSTIVTHFNLVRSIRDKELRSREGP